MKTAESKTTATAQNLQTKGEEQQPFFQQERSNGYLGGGSSAFFSSNHNPQPFFSKPVIQTKLSIGEPGNKYEQEADKMADQVVQRLAENNAQSQEPIAAQRQLGLKIQRKPIFESNAEPNLQAKFISSATKPINHIQAKCAECEQEEKLQKKEQPGEEEQLQKKPIFESNAEPPEIPIRPKLENVPSLQKQCAECATEEETPKVQRQSDSATTPNANSSLESRLSSSRGGGSPLPEHTRSQMEGAFGSDFSGVRVHTDSSAVQMNNELGAQAFTHGSDVYFNAGKYDDGSTEGKRLLGHELTHVVQQGGGIKVQRVCDPTITSCPQPSTPSTCDPTTASCHNPNQPISSEFANTGDSDLDSYSDRDIAQVGVFSLGVFFNNSANVVEPLRILYNQGVEAIKLVRADMIREALPTQTAEEIIGRIANIAIEEEAALARQLEQVMTREVATRIGQHVSEMRHTLALDTRRASGTILQTGAELVDAARGQARPTWESLIQKGKTPYQIMLSSTRTNGFINALPRVLRWTGRGLWIASAGYSIYTIISAPEEERARIAQEEIGGFIGGSFGMLAGEGICLLAAPETAGLSLLACGLLGGMVGSSLGRNRSFLEFLDIAPHRSAYQEGRMYKLEGVFDETDFIIFSIINREVLASEHVLVIATGTVSGEMVGGRGHYHLFTVIPANQPAVNLFGGNAARGVPNYILHPVTNEDMLVP